MSFRPHDIIVAGIPIPLSPTQAVTYLAERGKSPRSIEKHLRGQMTYDAIRSAMWRARKRGHDIPTWRGGFPKFRNGKVTPP